MYVYGCLILRLLEGDANDGADVPPAAAARPGEPLPARQRALLPLLCPLSRTERLDF